MVTKKINSKETIVNKVPGGFERKEKLQGEFSHHLYKLEVTMMRRNISYNPDKPIYEGAEHVHFYHSVNSDGVTQDSASPVGGHTHEVVFGTDENGKDFMKCGQPSKKYKGKFYPVKDDNHTHEITYIDSEERVIKRRVYNPEVVAAYNQKLNAGAPKSVNEYEQAYANRA